MSRLDALRSLSALLAAVALTGYATPAQQTEAPTDQPLDIGLSEEAGISLILLDVDVRDDQGLPLPGLARDDFLVWERNRLWEIYSVDDLCSCPASDAPSPGPDSPRDADSEQGPPAGGKPSPIAESSDGSREPRRFVMYFDFSQLAPDGRERAYQAASRWIREIMGPDDELMLAAYGPRTGLVRIAPFGSDPDALLARLDEGFARSDLMDTFPNFLQGRMTLCHLDAVVCEGYAQDEWRHGWAALRAFQKLLLTLELVPGHKEVFYFNQNGTIFPLAFYGLEAPTSTDFLGRNHLLLVRKIAAEALTARASINTVSSGRHRVSDPAAELAVSLGWNLGEFTGGDHNRTPQEIFPLLERVARRCPCTYRIGLRPRQPDKTGRYQLRVEAAGRTLPHRYVVQSLTPEDRVERKLLAHLVDPDTTSAFPVAASLRVVERRKRTWDVLLSVGLPSQALLQVPAAPERGTTSRWQIAGLVSSLERAEDRAFSGSGSLNAQPGSGRPATVLHRGIMSRLPAGLTTLSVVVHDQYGDTYATAHATLELPQRRSAAAAGPACATSGPAVRLPLSEWQARLEQGSEGLRESLLPCGAQGLESGRPLLMQSWVCPADPSAIPPRYEGYVARDRHPTHRLWPPVLSRSGDCFKVDQAIDTAALGPGPYVYHLVQRSDEGGVIDLGERLFELSAPEEVGPAEDQPRPAGP